MDDEVVEFEVKSKESKPWYNGLRRWMLASFALIVGAVMLACGKYPASEFTTLAIGIIAIFGGTDAAEKVTKIFNRDDHRSDPDDGD